MVAGTLEYELLRYLGLLALLGVGLIEEGAKLILPLIFYFLGRYRSEAAGIALGVFAAMGFAGSGDGGLRIRHPTPVSRRLSDARRGVFSRGRLFSSVLPGGGRRGLSMELGDLPNP